MLMSMIVRFSPSEARRAARITICLSGAVYDQTDSDMMNKDEIMQYQKRRCSSREPADDVMRTAALPSPTHDVRDDAPAGMNSTD